MSIQNVLPGPYHGIGIAGESTTNYGVGFSDLKIQSNMPIMKASLNSNKLDSRNAYYHKWEISISYNSLTRVQFNLIYPFLLYKKVTMQPFYVAIPPYYSQTLTGISLNGNHAKDVERLYITGTGVASGDIFTLAEKVYKVTRIDTGVIDITPSLQAAAVGSTSLVFANPLFKVKQLNDNYGYTLDSKNLYSISLEVEEAC